MITFARHRLSNGLVVLHHYDSATRMVALNLLYNVGARDEDPGHTGLAHLMEHLMFTGSRNAVNFDTPLENAGGKNNAFTTVDMTNYYDVLPAQNIETALWLESDRLLSLNLAPESINVQKSVVIEEFKQTHINRPYGDVSHLLSALAFTKHPYRWPTIGISTDHIADVPHEVIAQFYQRHYAVNNLILCVSGNISESDTLRLVEKWFGDIEPRDVPHRTLPEEPEQTAPRHLEVTRDVPQNVIFRAYHMGKRMSEQYPAADILSDILSNGTSSRLYQKLMLGTDLFTDISCSVSGTLDPGLFYIVARLAPETSFAIAAEAVDSELDRLQSEGVTDYELEKYVNKHIAVDAYQNVGYANVAKLLCAFEQMSSAELINTEPDSYGSLNRDDILLAASQILRPENCSTLLYHASGN